MTAPALTASEIQRRLREKYPLEEGWITMGEVTPPGTSRRFDLVAIMGWQSRGHEVLGFEIKVSRADWLRELKDPAKADPLVSLCSRWWIVAPPGVVGCGELPPAWGLLNVHENQIRVGRQAPGLNPAAWSDAVWRCMLLRLATREKRTPTEIAVAEADAYTKGRQAAEESARADVDRAMGRVRELEGIIAQAEKATGVRLSNWCDFPALGEAMQLIRGSGHRHLADDIERRAYTVRAAAVNMRRAARALRQQAELPAADHPSG